MTLGVNDDDDDVPLVVVMTIDVAAVGTVDDDSSFGGGGGGWSIVSQIVFVRTGICNIYLSIYIHLCRCKSTSSVSTSKQYSFCHGGSVCFVSAQLPDHGGSFVALVLPMEYSYFISLRILAAPGTWIHERDTGRGTPPDIQQRATRYPLFDRKHIVRVYIDIDI